MAPTFADHLRTLPDDALAALLRLRPDLIVPVPTDMAVLAVRAQSRLSVARALDGLDRFTLQILDALRLTRSAVGETSADAVLAALPTPVTPANRARVHAAVDRLRALFIAYGTDPALHLVGSVDEVCPAYPAGLGRPAAELATQAGVVCGDPARLRRELLAAPPGATAILDRLAAGPPVGTLRAGSSTQPAPPTPPPSPAASASPVTPAGDGGDPDSPVRWLIAHHLLVPIADGAVELPREVGMLLRRRQADGDGPFGPLQSDPPPADATPRDVRAVDSAGAGQVMEAVRHTGALVAALGAEAAPSLRAGGIGIRELRRLARAADIDEQVAAVLVEVAYAAGLIGEADGDLGAESRFIPALGYDAWRASPYAIRWAQLARAWLAMPRQPALVGTRDERERLISVLAPEVERAGVPARRVAALGVLADEAPGTTVTAESVHEQLAWRAPRRLGDAPEPTRWALAEAAILGVTGLGALTSYGRLLLEEVSAQARRDPERDPLGIGVGDPGDRSAAGTQVAEARTVATLTTLLPAPVDHVLVQADLTVVVPGPPEPALAAELSLLAEHESAGGASVYRVTPTSVRRALDAGYSAIDLHALFKRRSRTPVPQSLTYLVDDVARRHGGLRLGTAGCYLRSDDEPLLTEALADRRLAELGLRRLAPTVLVSPYAHTRLLSALREAGYAPVPEDASGATVLSRPKVRRAAGRSTAPLSPATMQGRAPVSAAHLAGIVEQIRRGDAAAKVARRAPVSVRTAVAGGAEAAQAHSQALAVLQEAVRGKQRVWVGYVDAHGATASRLVRPVSIGAGYLRAEDDRTETLHTFALHRITAAVFDEQD